MIRSTVRVQSRGLSDLARRMPQRADEVVTAAVFSLEGHMKRRQPVDTGTLRNSTQGRMLGPARGEVTVGAEYGVYVDQGTRYTPAQPFVGPAVQAVTRELNAAIRRILGG